MECLFIALTRCDTAGTLMEPLERSHFHRSDSVGVKDTNTFSWGEEVHVFTVFIRVQSCLELANVN